MICPRCLNEDDTLFAIIQGRYYCRKCIQFGRVFVDEKIEYPPIHPIIQEVDYHLKFRLVPTQQRVSEALVKRYKEDQDSVILAVCGGGKTEILYELIKTALNNGDSVLILIPRKALVMELGERLEKSFSFKPEMFYGGHLGNASSSFIISTIHQSYRLSPRDLVIVDEVDAYPLAGNELLEDMIKRVTRKHCVRMSATIESQEDLLYLKRRYHNVDLDIPNVYVFPDLILIALLIYYIFYFKKKNQPLLVYIPTFKLLRFFKFFPMIRSKIVSSHTNNIDALLWKLRKKELDVLFCTIVLERGITVDDVQVVVFHSEHHVFTRSTLIQIAGRVGRNKNHPSGKVIFLSTKYSQNIKDCLQAIKNFNA